MHGNKTGDRHDQKCAPPSWVELITEIAMIQRQSNLNRQSKRQAGDDEMHDSDGRYSRHIFAQRLR